MAVAYADRDPDILDNCVSWWGLSEASGTRADSHGGNDLTDNNTVGQAAGNTYGYGADFESTNTEYLDSTTGPGITGDWSVSFWVKPESNITGYLFASYTTNNGGILIRRNSGGTIFAQYGDGANSTKTTTSTSQLGTGTWKHVVITSDVSAGTSGYTIYVNGSSVALTASTNTATAVEAQADITIGAILSGTQPFDGVIQDVAIFSTILTSTQVTRMYNGGEGMKYSAGITYAVNDTDILDNCAAWWPLNEASGTRYDAHSTQDLTDNNTVGVLSGQWNRAADFEFSNNEYLSRSATTWGVSNAWTIACWLKAESLAANNRFIAIGPNNGANQVYALVLTSGKLNVHVRNSAGSIIKDYTGDTVMSVGNWYHIVITWDGTNLNAYINNTVETWTKNNDNSGTMTDTSRILNIGASNTGSAFWDGLIQDVSYHSAAFSTDQISRLYNSGNGMTYGVNFDASSAVFENPISGTVDVSHTVGGPDTGLVIWVIDNIASGSVSGVTYGGVSATQIGSTQLVAGNVDMYCYYLANPTAGTNTISVSHSSTGSWVGVVGLSYIGVSQDTPTNTAYNKGTNVTNVSTSITVSANSWIAGAARANSSGVTTANTNCIQRANASGSAQGYDTNGFQTAGSQTVIVNGGGGSESTLALFLLELEQYAPAAPAAATFIPRVMFY